jgi:ABC-type branched-subunit amino acid transport system substrate-binding protein
LVSLLLAAALIVVGSCPQQGWAEAESAKVVIGLLLPPEEAEAASLRAGVLLAVEYANQTSAPPVSVVVRGRTGQWGADAVEAARMVLDDGAQGLIAPPNGAATHLALQVAGRTAVPVVSLCSDSSVSQTGVPWMVQIAPTTIEEAKTVLAGLVAGTSHSERWTMLVPDGRAGREVARDLSQAASAVYCELKNVHEVNPSLTNLESVVAEVMKDQPDTVFVWLDPVPAGMLVKKLRTAGFAGKLTGPSRCNSPAFFASASVAAEGFLVPGIILDQAGEARFLAFQTAFRKRCGREPDLTAAESYDAATLLVHILRKTDAQMLPRAFPLAFSLPGASGDLSFDSAGNRKVLLRLLIARQGHFEPVERERRQQPQTQ